MTPEEQRTEDFLLELLRIGAVFYDMDKARTLIARAIREAEEATEARVKREDMAAVCTLCRNRVEVEYDEKVRCYRHLSGSNGTPCMASPIRALSKSEEKGGDTCATKTTK